LCLITFRSIRATIVALIPLVMTTIICKALMVWLGIGLKVATLPVIAVGVGSGSTTLSTCCRCRLPYNAA
jgi:predicted RND superfamily exporter protein